ncbi:ATP-grasp domain-containing protein, partial [Hydrogenimonas sp.]
ASDPAAPTQAYVANKLGLPSNPYESVEILSKKNLFRDFLEKNDFYVPASFCTSSLEKAENFVYKIGFPVVVKPTDSSGSKGVQVINDPKKLSMAFSKALEYSREKKVIIEKYIRRKSYQIGGDCFVVDGKVVFRCFTNTHFDEKCNPMAPVGGSLPSVYSKTEMTAVQNELQRVFDLLRITTGAFNVEFMYDQHGHLVILEVGARNGGNLIPELIQYATGADLIKYTVDAALGLDCSSLKMAKEKGFFAYYALHSCQSGILENILIDTEIENNIVEKHIYVPKGEKIGKFNGSNATLGILILKFDSKKEMLEKMDNMDKHLKVIVKNQEVIS